MRRGLRGFERSTVVVHMKTGSTLRGVLAVVHRDCVVLTQAENIDGEQPVRLAGEQVVPRENLDFFQRVPA